LGKLGRIWCRRFGEFIIPRDISHYTSTPLVERSRISAVLNEGRVVAADGVAVGWWVVAEAGLRWVGYISLLST